VKAHKHLSGVFFLDSAR